MSTGFVILEWGGTQVYGVYGPFGDFAYACSVAQQWEKEHEGHYVYSAQRLWMPLEAEPCVGEAER